MLQGMFMRRYLKVVAALVCVAFVSVPGTAAEFADEVKGLEHKPGLVDLYVDHAKARHCWRWMPPMPMA